MAPNWMHHQQPSKGIKTSTKEAQVFKLVHEKIIWSLYEICCMINVYWLKFLFTEKFVFFSSHSDNWIIRAPGHHCFCRMCNHKSVWPHFFVAPLAPEISMPDTYSGEPSRLPQYMCGADLETTRSYHNLFCIKFKAAAVSRLLLRKPELIWTMRFSVP